MKKDFKKFENIINLDKIIETLKNEGVIISSVDIKIADVLMELSQKTVIRTERIDYMGYATKGFIYNDEVQSLLVNIQNAVYLISKLDFDINFGFVDENGNVKREGINGDINKIRDVVMMINEYYAYNKGVSSAKIYSDKQSYLEEVRRKFNEDFNHKLNMLYGSHLGDDSLIATAHYEDGTTRDANVSRKRNLN